MQALIEQTELVNFLSSSSFLPFALLAVEINWESLACIGRVGRLIDQGVHLRRRSVESIRSIFRERERHLFSFGDTQGLTATKELCETCEEVETSS